MILHNVIEGAMICTVVFFLLGLMFAVIGADGACIAMMALTGISSTVGIAGIIWDTSVPRR